MKEFFLVLIILTSSSNYEFKKIKVNTKTSIDNFYCEQAFKKNTVWQNNPNYFEGNDEVWGYFTHQKKIVIGNFCIDDDGNYIL